MKDGSKFFERNNYYFGKLMTARDFTDEQHYLNEKRWLVNRLGLGWGVLCGLKVRPHKYEKDKVIVEPGVAIDQYGHEIFVCEETTIDLTPDDHSPDNPDADKKPYLYYVSIKYKEYGINPSPVPFDDCDGYKELCVYNRIREAYRFLVIRKPLPVKAPPEPGSDHDHDPSSSSCETECHRLLQDPSPFVGKCCPERPECEPVLLACICYNPENETTVMDIDMGSVNRNLAFSNENLYKLLSCLKNEVRQGQAAGTNRQQNVPLLASTIKGLKFQDGKNVRLGENDGYEGKYPFRLTSDGDYIWITDHDDKQIWRIKRSTNEPIKSDKLNLDYTARGIAFDGRYMWITHPDDKDDDGGGGKLTRVDSCTLETWKIFDGLPMCAELPHCYRFFDPGDAPNIQKEKLNPNPREIVLHDGDIYVAHHLKKHAGDAQQQDVGVLHGYKLCLTRIDPVRGCIIETIEIEEDGREPRSKIKAMASDGNALWITYQASSIDGKKNRVVVRKIIKKYDDKNKKYGWSKVGLPHKISGEMPEHMVFDGTRLWVSHNDGVSIVNIDIDLENEDIDEEIEDKVINQRTKHTALAYGGGEKVWAALPGANEAFINWIDIYSGGFGQWLEIIDDFPKGDSFEISDMQFDGTYIYIAYHLEQNDGKKGFIYRLLP